MSGFLSVLKRTMVNALCTVDLTKHIVFSEMNNIKSPSFQARMVPMSDAVISCNLKPRSTHCKILIYNLSEINRYQSSDLLKTVWLFVFFCFGFFVFFFLISYAVGRSSTRSANLGA